MLEQQKTTLFWWQCNQNWLMCLLQGYPAYCCFYGKMNICTECVATEDLTTSLYPCCHEPRHDSQLQHAVNITFCTRGESTCVCVCIHNRWRGGGDGTGTAACWRRRPVPARALVSFGPYPNTSDKGVSFPISSQGILLASPRTATWSRCQRHSSEKTTIAQPAS